MGTARGCTQRNAVAESNHRIANHGGKDSIIKTVPGTLKLTDENILVLTVDTAGTRYSTGGLIPLGRNTCTDDTGSWGVDSPETLCVKAVELDENNYNVMYNLKFIRLDSGLESYKIELGGDIETSGESVNVVIENQGLIEEEEDGNTVFKTLVSVGRD